MIFKPLGGYGVLNIKEVIIKMLTEEYILSKGYIKYPPTQYDRDIVICRYQKCFRDKIDKKFFIDILKNDCSYVPTDRRDKYWEPYSFEYELQVTIGKNECAINLLFHSQWTLEQVEGFVEDFFTKMNINYYELDEAK